VNGDKKKLTALLPSTYSVGAFLPLGSGMSQLWVGRFLLSLHKRFERLGCRI